MNIDLGSPILDVAIGLSFVFFLLSVIASAVSEAIAGVFNLRGKTLLAGIKGMIGDVEIAEAVFEHPLVRTNGMKKKPAEETEQDGAEETEQEGDEEAKRSFFVKLWAALGKPVAWLRDLERKPSYVSAENFAIAFLETKKVKEEDAAPPSVPETAKQHKLPVFLEKQLNALGVGKAQEIANKDIKKVEAWFDDSMERVSGWYKRRSQWVTLVIAIAVAVGLNANTVRIAERLEQEPAIRQAVATAAEKAIKKETPAPETAAQKQAREKEEGEGKKPPAAVVEIQKGGEHLSEASKELAALNLPIFWSKANALHSMPWWKDALGWLITVIAISLGAPFWFDTLNRLANLRLAGKSPEEKEKAKA
jgi:hypothetical protein